MNALIFFASIHLIKYLIKEYYPSNYLHQNKSIKYKVNSKSIQNQSHLSYYWQLLNIQPEIEYIDEQLVKDYYELSLNADKKIDPATILFVANTQLLNHVQDKVIDTDTLADKRAAKQYILDRIHYMHNLN